MPNFKGDDRAEAHFTPSWLIQELMDVLHRNYNGEITEFLEPSAGDGRLIDAFGDTPYIAYDINPLGNDIVEADYLKTEIEYKEGRVCVMNPPFAKGLKFVYKSLRECDYVVAIMSASSLLNLDYTKYHADEIQYIHNVDFGSCKVNISVMAIRKL